MASAKQAPSINIKETRSIPKTHQLAAIETSPKRSNTGYLVSMTQFNTAVLLITNIKIIIIIEICGLLLKVTTVEEVINHGLVTR